MRNFSLLFVWKKTLEKKNHISYIFSSHFFFHFIISQFLRSSPARPLGISKKKLQNLSVARLGPRGASQILWVSKTRTSIAHANVSGLEFADERNEGQEAEAKARAKRRRYKTHITIHFFNFSFLGSWCEILNPNNAKLNNAKICAPIREPFSCVFFEFLLYCNPPKFISLSLSLSLIFDMPCKLLAQNFLISFVSLLCMQRVFWLPQTELEKETKKKLENLICKQKINFNF